MKIKSFAKINLGLEILGRRADGYHRIRTLFQSVGLCDELVFSPTKDGRVEVRGDDRSIPWDASNLIHRAAEALRDRHPGPEGVHVEVRKRIPAGKGLGGGSGNAAATLLVLNRMWGLDLGDEELTSIGSGLGADIPFFLYGGLCLGEERGDRITPLEDFPPLPTVIVFPPFSCPTAEIYRAFDEFEAEASSKLTSVGKDSKIVRFFSERDVRSLENSLEATVFRFHPRLKDLKCFSAGGRSCPWSRGPGRPSSVCSSTGKEPRRRGGKRSGCIPPCWRRPCPVRSTEGRSVLGCSQAVRQRTLDPRPEVRILPPQS